MTTPESTTPSSKSCPPLQETDCMDPIPAGVAASDASQTGARLNSIGRNQFFTGLFFLGCANGIAARAVATVYGVGWLNALIGTFDVSAIVVAACVSGLWLMMSRREQSVT